MLARSRLLCLLMLAVSGCIGSGGTMGFSGIQHGVVFNDAQDVGDVGEKLTAMGYEVVESTDRGVVTSERDGVTIETVGRPGDPWAFRARIATRFETRDHDTLTQMANETALAQREKFETILGEFERRTGLSHAEASYEWRSLTWVE